MTSKAKCARGTNGLSSQVHCQTASKQIRMRAINIGVLAGGR